MSFFNRETFVKQSCLNLSNRYIFFGYIFLSIIVILFLAAIAHFLFSPDKKPQINNCPFNVTNDDEDDDNYYKLYDSSIEKLLKTDNADVWAKAPRFSLSVRMYAPRVGEYWKIFAISYLLFWPKDKWKTSDLVLIFDDESAADHQAGTIVSLLPPYPKIKYEPAPPPGTLCSDWRSEGFARQMWSNFYADTYSDADFIGIADTDSFFSTKVVIEDLFENGKPRIIGYNGCCIGWEEAASSLTGGRKLGAYMIVLGFPFIVKREHFKPFREHVRSVFKKETFDESFHHVCKTWDGTNDKRYTQYDFLAYYLFTHHRNEYAWHIRDGAQAHHPAMRSPKRMTNEEELRSFSTPKIGVMKHSGHGGLDDFPFIIYDYVCTEANFSDKVGSCSREPHKYRDAIRQSVEYNLLTDWLAKTAYMTQRGLPENAIMIPKEPYYECLPNNYMWALKYRAHYKKRYNGSWYW